MRRAVFLSSGLKHKMNTCFETRFIMNLSDAVSLRQNFAIQQ